MIPDNQIEMIDIPELPETFVDAVSTFAFDGDTLRVELCVTRFSPLEPSQKVHAKRYPACRLVLTKNAAMTLNVKLQDWLQQMQKQQKIDQKTVPSPAQKH